MVVIGLICASARADTRQPIVSFRVKGDSKVISSTLEYLSHVHVGDTITPAELPQIQTALISSELFESVKVELEPTTGGVTVVATVVDKLSWIAAPTVYVLPGNQAFGAGYVQNDLAGRDQKLLLYGQIGTQQSILLATFLDPAVHGSKLTYRLDLYAEHRIIDEYANPPGDERSFDIARTTTETFLDAGALIGWNLAWWAVADFRLRGAYVYFRNPQDNTGAATTSPEKDGWDVTGQARLTLDHRFHNFGVTRGAYAQLELEQSIPGLDEAMA